MDISGDPFCRSIRSQLDGSVSLTMPSTDEDGGPVPTALWRGRRFIAGRAVPPAAWMQHEGFLVRELLGPGDTPGTHRLAVPCSLLPYSNCG